MKIHHYGFWIFKEGLFDLLDFFHRKINLPLTVDNELVKYELHYTDGEQNLWFTLLIHDVITIKVAKDSNDRDIIFFNIEYTDLVIREIKDLEEFINSK
ncbi:hypothetical protein [Chryseobacterium sp. ISL-6]|uniref:hypothetical protein n=1 Tax=Chryseobacterium sp. ISL-6 TaxID=2819143 RepID=UPI001BEAF2D9|nr:hypothetical protein [Chryseobacterium sp. ISL-6]MBT2621204.1 hypothetical protein [Chryseobacterium sp. ISL-6]